MRSLDEYLATSYDPDVEYVDGVLEKLAEYEAKGIQHIWLVDPRLKLMSIYRSGNLNHVEAFRAGEIELLPAEIFLQ